MKTKTLRNMLSVVLLVFLTGLPLSAASDSSYEKTKLMLVRQKKHIQDLSPAELSSRTKISDIGNVAVITGNKKTFFPRNPFDLIGRKISFIPNRNGGYDVKVSAGSLSASRGNNIPVTSESKRIIFTSGFSFTYFGVTYTSLLVNGCGNVTFGQKGTSCNSLFGYLTGPPVILPFEGSYPDEVQIQQSATKFTITWRTVSPDSPVRPNSQLNLLKNGTIEFLYGGNPANDGRTGISPGNATSSDLQLVNFSAGSTHHGKAKTAFFEEFRSETQVDLIAVLHEFHETHPQIFDFITIFTDYSYPYESRYFSPTQNSIKGIGLGRFGIGSGEYFGSSQLQGFLMMNSLNDYPSDPKAPLEGTFNTLQMMANLHGKRWLPHVRVKVNGVKTNDLLGGAVDFFYEGIVLVGRWNFFMDTDASVMGGNDITDNGNGTFTTTAAILRYSKLDQYIMGLIPASAVPPFFYAGTKPTEFDFFSESSSLGSGSEPQVGVTFSGTRVNVNINQVIQAEGPRVPSSKTSQKVFREAFIFFLRPGRKPTSQELEKLNRIRIQWQAWFENATGRHGKIETRLK